MYFLGSTWFVIKENLYAMNNNTLTVSSFANEDLKKYACSSRGKLSSVHSYGVHKFFIGIDMPNCHHRGLCIMKNLIDFH